MIWTNLIEVVSSIENPVFETGKVWLRMISENYKLVKIISMHQKNVFNSPSVENSMFRSASGIVLVKTPFSESNVYPSCPEILLLNQSWEICMVIAGLRN